MDDFQIKLKNISFTWSFVWKIPCVNHVKLVILYFCIDKLKISALKLSYNELKIEKSFFQVSFSWKFLSSNEVKLKISLFNLGKVENVSLQVRLRWKFLSPS